MPKHWWEVPALKDVYQLRLDHLRREMREQFQRDYVRVLEASQIEKTPHIKDAEPPARASVYEEPYPQD